MLCSLMTGFADHAVTAIIRNWSDNLELESELHYLVTTLVTSAILAADYFCLVSYISSAVTSQKVSRVSAVSSSELVRCTVG